MSNGRNGQQAGTIKRPWSDAENGILRVFYATHGPVGCAKLLDGRSPASVKAHAHRTEVTLTRPPVKVVKPRQESNATPIPAHDEHADAYFAWQSVRVPAFAAGNLGAVL